MIEEFLDGEEASFFALVDGEKVVPLIAAQVSKAAASHPTLEYLCNINELLPLLVNVKPGGLPAAQFLQSVRSPWWCLVAV